MCVQQILVDPTGQISPVGSTSICCNIAVVKGLIKLTHHMKTRYVFGHFSFFLNLFYRRKDKASRKGVEKTKRGEKEESKLSVDTHQQR